MVGHPSAALPLRFPVLRGMLRGAHRTGLGHPMPAANGRGRAGHWEGPAAPTVQPPRAKAEDRPPPAAPDRYAASDPVAAARERFPAGRITTDAADLQLVRLDGPPPALHLTHQANLDALDLDDRINTARLDQPLPGMDDPLLVSLVTHHGSDVPQTWL